LSTVGKGSVFWVGVDESRLYLADAVIFARDRTPL
jgi:hypothetical protein